MNHPIVTGQQIGLLGGPLYTTYKVLGAIALARDTQTQPIYWLETNDADFNEINHIDYLDSENQLKTLTWNISSQGYACGYIEIDSTLIDLLNLFFDTIRQTEFTPILKKMVLDCYAPGRTLAEASLELASRIFKPFGIRLFTPFEPDFREFSQHILRKEAERTPEGEQCKLFCLIGKQRKALFKNNNRFVLRDGTPIDIYHTTLLPNVVTRCICQDAYFHTQTYVAGPGEVKYLSQLGPDYAFHDVKQASVQPRMSLILIEPKVRRLLERNGLIPGDITDGGTKDQLMKFILKKQGAVDINERINQSSNLTDDFLSKLEPLGIAQKDIKNLRKIIRQELKNAFGELRAREKEKYSQQLADIDVLTNHLKPFGKPQERVFNVFYYMNLFGGENFINTLALHHHFNRKLLEIGGKENG